MNLNFSELLQLPPLTEEEIARLDSPSPTPCFLCNGPLSVGEDENAGCCTKCYFKTEENER